MGDWTHNLLPPRESHARTEHGKTSDNQQRTTNHTTLPSRQLSSLNSDDVFNINAPANGAIRLNRVFYNMRSWITSGIMWWGLKMSISPPPKIFTPTSCQYSGNVGPKAGHHSLVTFYLSHIDTLGYLASPLQASWKKWSDFPEGDGPLGHYLIL